ncbi:hypothetical protein [Tessaracoccus flavus]|uniref:Uncharacterized protein n=1 Tax=Tessaracoccus flavus TaxID=1610493 RepID=A0A1Q2CGF1_9ACTN|nr:hypothetical protein [Tessaracoccus flavus]AQP45191.1 hypothetical protein RPIT_10600 [Tessaracoccus flavus]SDY53649.1 hypothetical protein SAMN05428934_102185 [Tessaracoccus flavus]
MEMSPKPGSHAQLGRTFIAQQRVISVLSFFLPLFLITWSVLSGEGLRGSLSEYYYTPVRDIFVGVLCALSLFFWSYRGYHPHKAELRADRVVAKIASVSAALVALAPLKPRQVGECTLLQCVFGEQATDWVHNVAAVIFMTSLATFCLVLFPMTAIQRPDLGRRLVIYGICGTVIVAAMLLMVLWKFLPVDVYFALGHYKPIFMLETMALFAFSIAWLLRSRAVEDAALAQYDD